MNDFLPTGYTEPPSVSNYMKFKDEVNRFRILGSAIVGWETFVNKKPLRKRLNNPFDLNEIEDNDPKNIKHFWAFPVYNYQEKRIQILEITQRTIQKAIKALSNDEDWGDVTEYDIVVTKSGEGLETEYSIQPKPAKPMDKTILDMYKNMHINLEALYDGADPFKDSKVETNEIIEPNEIPF